MNDERLKADFGLGNDQVFEVDEENRFNFRFEIDEPGYFSLGRNKLYLSPGDRLNLTIDYRNPEAATFQGDHATRQQYLSEVAFPKSGSYLEGGSALNGSAIETVLSMAQVKTEERRAELKAMAEQDEMFIRLEELRLRLDLLNTLLSFPVYGSFKGYWDYSEEKKVEILSEIRVELNEFSDGIMQDEHMRHPNFREMILDLVNPQLKKVGVFSELKLTPYMLEYDEMGAFVSQLESEGLTPRIKAIAEDYLQHEHAEDYKTMLKKKLAEYEALEKGQPAFDLQFTDANGELHSLKEFQGELLYVDLWATWCGPCIAELPAFERLKEDFEDQPVAFIPISIDTDVERWKRYLESNELPQSKEYLINRLDLDDYKVITIPRYFLIDRDFNIIDVFATVPSDEETRRQINAYLYQ